MNELAEIDSVRVYQAVTFDKRSETFFSTRDINTKMGKSITVNDKYHGIEIKSNTDHIFVPFTNVSCIYFRSELKMEQMEMAEKAKAKNVGIKPQELKKPKKISRG